MPRRKKKPALRTYKPGSEAEAYDVLQRCRRELAQMGRDGLLAEDVKVNEWHPAARIAHLAEKADTSDSLKFLCYKTLLEYVEVPKAAALKLPEQGGAPPRIMVEIASWARGNGAPQIEHRPRAVEPEGVAARDPEKSG